MECCKMTVEEALNIDQNWTSEQAKNDLERLLLRDERPANKVIALACKALEKQMPKKVIPYCGSPVGMACPECGTFQDFTDKETLNNRSEYCYKCGQALDWSD